MADSEIRLNEAETADIWDIYHHLPVLKTASSVYGSIITKSPASVKLAKSQKMAPELRILFDLYWIKWDFDSYIWETAFGVVPWRPIDISGTIHRYPTVPKYGSGYISTYLDKDGLQRFKWYWTVGSKLGEDKSFFFETKSNPPDINGHYTSAIAALLPDWRTTKIVREATEIASYQQARVQHVFEYHPPKNVPGDDNLATLEEFGDTIAGTVMSQQEGLQNAKMTIRSDALQDAISTANAKNRGLKAKFGTPYGYLKSDNQGQKWELDNANILEKGIPLKADYYYKAVASPQVHANLTQLCERLDHMASALMDIPIALIEGMGKSTANVQGSFRILNERIKDRQEYRKRTTKKAFLIIYGKMIQEDLNRRIRLIRNERPNVMLELYADTEVEVKIKDTPIISVADVQNLNLAGYIQKEVAAKHIFNILGLPEEDISVTKDPPQERGAGEPQTKKYKPVI
jgi:hypothetical protein